MVEVPSTILEKTAAAMQGDSRALGTIFEWYRPRLYAHSLRICGNTPVAEDAVQETFISAFTHYTSLRDPGSFYPWLKRILINHCYRLLSREKYNSLELTPATTDSLIQESVEKHFEKTAHQQWVFDLLGHLSEELRSCVMLRYFSNYNRYDEIAEVLDIPIGTVRSRLAAAREKFLTFGICRDTGDRALKEAQEWSNFYYDAWGKLYDDSQARQQFIEHFHILLKLRYTSGKSGLGRKIVTSLINEDLKFGSAFKAREITSSGNITIVEGINYNTPEHIDRCPPHSVFVFFRRDDMTDTFHIFDSPRPKL